MIQSTGLECSADLYDAFHVSILHGMNLKLVESQKHETCSRQKCIFTAIWEGLSLLMILICISWDLKTYFNIAISTLTLSGDSMSLCYELYVIYRKLSMTLHAHRSVTDGMLVSPNYVTWRFSTKPKAQVECSQSDGFLLSEVTSHKMVLNYCITVSDAES